MTMCSSTTRALALLILTATPVLAATSGGVRLCVGAGQMFPETAEGLRDSVVGLLNEAEAPAPPGPLVAMVVPHGPYGISGAVAAAAFKHVEKGQFDRVIVLGASHADMTFQGCSIAAVDAYATPMGLVPLDKEAVRKLCYSALFGIRSMRYEHLQRGFLTESERKPLHEYEHSIEIVLPFLQERLGSFELVPILVGRLTDGSERYSEMRTEAVAEILRDIIDEKTLIVVSTDFVHFGNDFSYRPFSTDILNKIDELDMAGLKHLGTNDFDAFDHFIKTSQAPICGLNALRVLLKVLPDNARGTILGHATSGRFYNNENRSVSYASMNFYLLDNPPPRPKKIPRETAETAREKGSASARHGKAPVTITNTGEQDTP